MVETVLNYWKRKCYSENSFTLKSTKHGKNHLSAYFRITITISGSNGIQNIWEMKKYYVSDFVEGAGFSAIKYEGKDTDKLGIKYKRISDFWLQFEKIRAEKPIV